MDEQRCSLRIASPPSQDSQVCVRALFVSKERKFLIIQYTSPCIPEAKRSCGVRMLQLTVTHPIASCFIPSGVYVSIQQRAIRFHDIPYNHRCDACGLLRVQLHFFRHPTQIS